MRLIRPGAQRGSRSAFLVLLLMGFGLGLPARGASETWTGAGSDLLWTTPGNWLGTNLPPLAADDVLFGASFTSGTAINLNGSQAANSLTLATGLAISLNNNTLTLGAGGLTRAGTTYSNQTLNSAVTLGASQAWTNNSLANSLIAAGTLTLGGNALTITGPGNTTLSGQITGAGTVTKSGRGTLNIPTNANSNASNYTGQTVVSGGILKLTPSAATTWAAGVGPFGASGAGNEVVVTSGGTLLFNTAGFTATDNSGQTMSLAGTGFNGLGALAVGAPYSAASAANATTNATITLTANTTIGSVSARGTGYGASPNLTLSGPIAGAFTLTKVGNGDVTLSGNNTGLTGGIVVTDGKLYGTGANALGDRTSAVGKVLVTKTSCVAWNYNFTTADLLNRFDTASTGVIALATNNTNNLDLTGFNDRLRLGSTGNVVFSGTLTPPSNVYRFGGAANTYINFTKLDAVSGNRDIEASSNPYAYLPSQTGGRMNFQNANNNLTGTVDIRGLYFDDGTARPNWIVLSSNATTNGSMTGVTSWTIRHTGSLWLNDDTDIDNGYIIARSAPVDRLGDTSTIINESTFYGLYIFGSKLADTGEKVGTLRSRGQGLYQVNATTGNTKSYTFTADTLDHATNRGVSIFSNSNNNLGAPAAPYTRIILNNNPTGVDFVGTSTTADTVNLKIIPSTFTCTTGGTINTLATYDATLGIRPLTIAGGAAGTDKLGEYRTLLKSTAHASDDNVRFAGAAGEGAVGNTTINALVLAPTAAVAVMADNDILNVTSGTIAAFAQTTTLGVTAGASTLNFGTAEGGIMTSGGNLTVNSRITGSGGLTKSGGNTLVLAAPNNSWSGGTVVNLGALQINAIGALPAISNDVFLNGGYLYASVTNANLTVPNNITIGVRQDSTGTRQLDGGNYALTLTGLLTQGDNPLWINAVNEVRALVYLNGTRPGAGETGRTMVEGGALAVSSMSQLASGYLDLGNKNGRATGFPVGGTFVLGSTGTAGVPTWAQFIAARPTMGTEAGQWTLTGGGFSGKGGGTVTLSGGPLTTDTFNRDFVLGSNTRATYTVPYTMYCDAAMDVAQSTTLTRQIRITSLGAGPGLNFASGSYTTHRISGDLSDAANGKGAVVIHGAAIDSNAVPEIVLAGTNNWTGSASTGTEDGQALDQYGSAPYFNTGPGGLLTGGRYTTHRGSFGFVRFAGSSSLPSGNGGAPAYLAAIGGNVSSPTGLLLTNKPTTEVYEPAAGYKFLIGTIGSNVGNAGGTLGAASNDGTAGNSSMLRNTTVAMAKADGTVVFNGLMLVRDGTLTLGDAAKPVVFQSVVASITDPEMSLDSPATPLSDDASAFNRRQWNKYGPGTLVLKNVAYQKLDGTDNAAKFDWQIGRGTTANVALTANTGGNYSFFDGAVRSRAGGDNTNSLTNFYVALAGGVLEVDGNGSASSFTRSLGTSGSANVGWGSINNGTLTAGNGGGGFAAFNGNLSVLLNNSNASPLVWASTANFVPVSNPLMFGSQTADSTVDFQNDINLNNTEREFRVFRGVGSVPEAKLSGIVSSTTAASGALLKTEAGTLVLNAANTYTGATRIFGGGTLRFGVTGALQAGTTITVAEGTLDLNGLNYTANNAITLGGGAAGTTAAVTTGGGILTLGNSVTYSAANNPNGATISGSISLTGTRNFSVGDTLAATNDLTVNAAMSSTGAFGISKDGAGTLMLTGVNLYTGTTTANAGDLRVGGTSGALTATSGITVSGIGTRFTIDNSTAASSSRINDAATVTMSTGTDVRLYGGPGGNVNEAVGALGVSDGRMTITVGADPATSAALSFASINRNYQQLFLVRGSNLGQGAPGTAGVSNVLFTDSTGISGSFLKGGTGGAATTTQKVITFMVGDTSPTGYGSDLVTYDLTQGVRALSLAAGEYKTTITDAQTQLDNVRLNTPVSLANSTTINALLLAAGGSVTVASGKTLTVSSGVVTPIGDNVTISGGTIGGGGGEFVVQAVRDLTIDSVVSGTLYKSGLGTVTLKQSVAGFGRQHLGVVRTGAAGVFNGVALTNNSGEAIVDFNGYDQSIASSGNWASMFMNTSATPCTLTVTGGLSGQTFGPLNVKFTGAGALGHNSSGINNMHTGWTWATKGTVSSGGSGRLSPYSVVRLGDSAGSTSGTLDLTNADDTIAGLADEGSGNVAGNSSTSANRILTIRTAGSDSAFSGVVKDTLGTGNKNVSIIKAGLGKQTFSGANAYTGTTAVNAGTLELDYTANNNAKIGPAAVLTLSGGALRIVGNLGGGYTQTVSSTTVAAGASGVSQASGATPVNLNVITRTVAGGTVNFSKAGTANTTTDTNNTNGILGGWATFGGTDWAKSVDSGAADTAISAYSAYTTNSDPTTWVAGNNVNLSGNPIASVTTRSINSLRFDNAATLTLGLLQTLTLTSGGLLVTGSNPVSITGYGTLKGANTVDLVVHQNSTADLTIDAVIDNNTGATALTKAGTGRLLLNGNNLYTGTTYVTNGTVKLGHANALGAANATTVAVGATLDLNGQAIPAETFTVGGPGYGSIGALINSSATPVIVGGTVALSGYDASIGGTGNLILNGAVSGGTSLGFNKIGGGTVTLNAANSYTGLTTVAGGTLVVNGTIGAGTARGTYVAAGAVLAGSGTVGGAPFSLSGAGLVSPGGSPGVLTTATVDATQGLDFAFEFTGTGSPLYAVSTASINDVLRVTGAYPFPFPLTTANIISIYMNVPTLGSGDVFRGGLYADNYGDFQSRIQDASFAYYVRGDGNGPVAFNGTNYYLMSAYYPMVLATLATVPETASFGPGPASSGYVTQFSFVVPEPGTLFLLAGAALAALRRRARR